MKILVFAASGQTGREILRQALEQEHEVTAFVRDRKKPGPLAAQVHVIQGDITDPATVTQAVEGQAAVLSTVGAPTPMRPYPASPVWR